MTDCRTKLWWLIFLGMAINFMDLLNMNIAIPEMVTNWYSNTSQSSVNEKFSWDEHQQNLILGSMHWFFWITELAGGILGNKYGTKLVFGLSTVATCSLGFLIPMAAKTDYRILICIRVIQGILHGFTFPSLHAIVGYWIPPNQRSKFTTAYMGLAIGKAIIFSMGGIVIHWFGWPTIFYIPGVLGLIWYAAWLYLVYDSPDKHPRISEKERNYIQQRLREEIMTEKPPIPWKHILTSFPVWVNLFSSWGIMWGLYLLAIQGPTYFKIIHKWDIRKIGILIGVPCITQIIFSFLISVLCDHLLTKFPTSRTNIRKMAAFIGCIVQGIFLFGIGLSGNNSTLAIICYTMSLTASGSMSSSVLARVVDLSPNYASVILGLNGMIISTSGFLIPLLVGFLTYENQTTVQWQKVFFISAAAVSIPGFNDLCFSSAELQEWNNPRKMKSHELQKLQNSVETC